MKQESSRQWFSDVSYQTVGGYCLETGWWWRYGLSEEERRWTVRIRARVGYDSLLINVLDLFGMVWTVDVMIVIRKDLPRREAEAVLMREEDILAIATTSDS